MASDVEGCRGGHALLCSKIVQLTQQDEVGGGRAAGLVAATQLVPLHRPLTAFGGLVPDAHPPFVVPFEVGQVARQTKSFQQPLMCLEPRLTCPSQHNVSAQKNMKASVVIKDEKGAFPAR